MAAKKSASKKAAKKTFMQKIGETASHLKEEIVLGKDHIAEVAGDAIESIKSSIHNITHKKKAAKKTKPKAKKIALKKVKVPVKKVAKAAKKVVAKSAKKAAKKK